MPSSIPAIILSASATTSCLYWIFFYFSPFIWSLNSPSPVNDYMPGIRPFIYEHNGIQVYVLYLLMFLNLGFSFSLYTFFLNIKRSFFKNSFLIIALGLSYLFLRDIGFHPPMSFPAITLPGYMFVGWVFLITMFLLVNYKDPWMPSFVFVALFVICLVTAAHMQEVDWGNILSPAWRLLHGVGLNRSFCIYDYFMSIISALWMWFFPLETIPLLGRLSYFALFFGCYLFARCFFNYKQLAIFLLISVVITKIYGNIGQLDQMYQVSPWRLDWWIVLVALAYWKTMHHWAVGVTLGFLIIFHHAFGCIYAVSYVLLILILIIVEMTGGKNSFAEIISKYFYLFRRNFIYIISAFLLYRFFLQPPVNISVFIQKTGYGCIPISRRSFYWYFPVVSASAFLFLYKNRNLLSQKYFETSIFLLSLIIGNSIYCFHRFHENSIVNIAAGLLMVLYLFLDLLNFELKQFSLSKFSRWTVPLCACAVILIISYQYAGRALCLLDSQISNFKSHRFYYSPCSEVVSYDFPKLRTLTHFSQKVIFISQKDFFFCYIGKYPLPQNYNCFYASWFFWKDYADFLNDQLKKGFYIVVPQAEVPNNRDIISDLKYLNYANTREFLVISNNIIHKTLRDSN